MTAARGVTWSVLALAALTVGCGDSLAPVVCPGAGCATQVSTRKTFQYGVSRKVDVLFVVDDTPVISPHLGAIATGVAEMANDLTNALYPISVHAGVVRAGTCDPSTHAAACGVGRAERFVRSEWCNTMTNVSGSFTDALTCLAALGSDNCGPAQPLSAAVQALSGAPRAGWEEFLRPEAYLLIIVIAAGDDASGSPGQAPAVVDLARQVKGVKADPSQVAVSIIGPADCAPGDVRGPRLLEFANEFGASGLYVGLCSGQLAAAVQRITEFTNEALAPPCITNVRDVDAETPGLQPNCTVTRTQSQPLTGSTIEYSLSPCDGSRLPCWRLQQNAFCGDAPGTVFTIANEPEWCSEGVTTYAIECLVCADANDPACAPMMTMR